MTTKGKSFLVWGWLATLVLSAYAVGSPKKGPQFPLVNSCGNQGSTPQIRSITQVGPNALTDTGTSPVPSWIPTSGSVTRDGIEYLSGTGLVYELVTDGCTYIKTITLGSTTVTTTPSVTGGASYLSDPSTTNPTNNTQTGYHLTITLPYIIDGSTDQLTITMGRTSGSGTATYSVPLVHVKAVNPAASAGAVTISRVEIWNALTRGLYDGFGGPAHQLQLYNAPSGGGSGSGSKSYLLYDYDPTSVTVSMDSGGIFFSFKFKAQIKGWCDPTVTAYGTFQLVPANGGLSIQWQPGSPTASYSWPARCVAVEGIPLLGLLFASFIPSRQDNDQSLGSTLAKDIMNALPSATAILGVSHMNNEVQIRAVLLGPSIDVHVPYDALSPSRSPTLFSVTEPLLLVGSGLGMSDTLTTPYGSVHSDWSGPHGVPLAGTVSGWPTPETFSRASALPFPGRAVANVLARMSSAAAEASATTYAYADGCTIGASSVRPGQSSTRSILFGVNDTSTDAAREAGAAGYDLTIAFMKALPTGSACPSMSPTNSVLRSP